MDMLARSTPTSPPARNLECLRFGPDRRFPAIAVGPDRSIAPGANRPTKLYLRVCRTPIRSVPRRPRQQIGNKLQSIISPLETHPLTS